MSKKLIKIQKEIERLKKEWGQCTTKNVAKDLCVNLTDFSSMETLYILTLLLFDPLLTFLD